MENVQIIEDLARIDEMVESVIGRLESKESHPYNVNRLVSVIIKLNEVVEDLEEEIGTRLDNFNRFFIEDVGVDEEHIINMTQKDDRFTVVYRDGEDIVEEKYLFAKERNSFEIYHVSNH